MLPDGVSSMKIATQPQAGGRSPVAAFPVASAQHTASRLLLDSYFIAWFAREDVQKLVSAGRWGRAGAGPPRALLLLQPSRGRMRWQLAGGRGRWLPTPVA